MPIIFGTSSKDPDVWKCDYDEKCKAEEVVMPERVPKGWWETKVGDVFCPDHSFDETRREV